MNKIAIALVACVLVLIGISYAQQSGYTGDIPKNSPYGGASICGLNYDCGVVDGICPADYGTSMTCHVCDSDCKYLTGQDGKILASSFNGGKNGDTGCDGKTQNTNYPYQGLNEFKCDSLCKFSIIDHTKPTSILTSPTGWQTKDFTIGIKDEKDDIDNTNIDCKYSVTTKRYDAESYLSTSKTDTVRTCSADIPVSLNDCSNDGIGACHITITATDKSGNKNEATLDVDVDRRPPQVVSYSLNDDVNSLKIERQNLKEIKVKVQDTFPSGTNSNINKISGMKYVQIILKYPDGRTVVNGEGKDRTVTCTSASKTDIITCSLPAVDVAAGAYKIGVNAEDIAGNKLNMDSITDSQGSPITFFVNDPPTVNSISYSGECKTGGTITVQCSSYDPNQNANTLTTNLWAGECSTSDCSGTRSWNSGKGVVYYNGEKMIPPETDITAGSVPLIGNIQVTPNTPGQKAYTLSCVKNGQYATSSIIVDVSGAAQPSNAPLITRFEMKDPADVVTGQTFTLLWESNADSCQADGRQWDGTNLPASGSRGITPSSAGPTTYSITCTKAGVSATASMTLYVKFSHQDSSPPRIISFQKTGDAVAGRPFTLQWNAENAETCEIKGGMFAKTLTITSPNDALIAATCRAFDNQQSASNYADAYPLCQVNGCVSPPNFQNIMAIKNTDKIPNLQINQFVILFDASKPLPADPVVTVNYNGGQITLKTPFSKSGLSYAYAVPVGISGIVQISISGADADKCAGNSLSDAVIDPCIGFVCSTPPADSCRADGKTLIHYIAAGACSADSNNNPTCSYGTTSEICEYGCTSGKCNANSAPKIDAIRLLLP